MQTDPQYKLRLPADLKDKIKAASEENHRSMNAEIVARLEESFSDAVNDKPQLGRVTKDERLSKAIEELRVLLGRLDDGSDEQEKSLDENKPEKLDIKDDLLK